VSDNDGDAPMSQEQVESLRASATAISRELKTLGDQVASLMEAVTSLGPPAAERKAPPPAVEPEVIHETEGLEMTVTVQPLPELAMAAVAETTLRSLPGVRSVKGVKREGDWARFTLEVSPDADLVTEMKAAMPVSFKVTESTPEAVSLDLKWAWGAS
jgi:muconolactone delta-isomerase